MELLMSLSKSTFLEIGGMVAVVMSLLFVGYQIQQANRIAIVTTEYELRNNYSSLNELIIGNQELAQLFVNISQPDYEMTAIEEVRMVELANRLLNIWLAIETAYDNGMLSEHFFNATFQDIDAAVTPEMRHVLQALC